MMALFNSNVSVLEKLIANPFYIDERMVSIDFRQSISTSKYIPPYCDNISSLKTSALSAGFKFLFEMIEEFYKFNYEMSYSVHILNS